MKVTSIRTSIRSWCRGHEAQRKALGAIIPLVAGLALASFCHAEEPNGNVVGKYRKSHRLPDEPIALGDELPVFETQFGHVGLMIATDRYWPEVPLVMALEGAELILWSHAPEPVPQAYPLDVTMRVRALDDHVTLVSSGYAGELPYLCSNHPQYTEGDPRRRLAEDERAALTRGLLQHVPHAHGQSALSVGRRRRVRLV